MVVLARFEKNDGLKSSSRFFGKTCSVLGGRKSGSVQSFPTRVSIFLEQPILYQFTIFNDTIVILKNNLGWFVFSCVSSA